MKDKEKLEEIRLPLEVKESHINGEDGVARISDSVLVKLGAEEGHSIEVASEEDEILVTIYADKLIEDNLISLRPGDRKKLGVSQGDTVTLKLSKPWGESIKEKLHIGKDEEEDEEK
jgi:formylmethanofuran dehydrogenase subunit D